MKALSLFNGISALHLALDKAEIQVGQVYYAEIDKYANQVTQHHYPDDVALGDVTRWREWDIDWSGIDLVTAGFPCQAWSVAGKQLGDKDERGMLFWTTLEIIKHVLYFNPSAKFIMENVKMKKAFEEYITHHTTQALGSVHKILIDSALVSAQSRKRYYWTNFEVTQPDDKGILLKDIIENDFVDRDKSYCIDAHYHKGGNPDQYFNKSRRQLVFKDSTFSDFRKLTPLECERLQTFPDGWADCISNTQRYKCLGNGWTIDTIAHILACGFPDLVK